MNGPHLIPLTAAPGGRPAAGPRPAGRPDRVRPTDQSAAPPVLTYLRLHWLAILCCGGLLGTVLAFVAWSSLPSKYESYAVLRVTSNPASMASGDPTKGQAAFTTYVQTQMQFIRTDRVLRFAVNESRLADLPTLRDQKDPVKYLEEKLIVANPNGSELIRVGFEGDHPDDVRAIVDAVKDAYSRQVLDQDRLQKAREKEQVEQAKVEFAGLMQRKVGAPGPAQGLAPGPAQAGGVSAPPPLGEPGAVVQAGAFQVKPADPGGQYVESDEAKRAKFQQLVGKSEHLRSRLIEYPVSMKRKEVERDDLKRQIDALQAAPVSAEAMDAAAKDPEVVQAAIKADSVRREAASMAVTSRNPAAARRLRADADQLDAAATRLQEKKARDLDGARLHAVRTRLVNQYEAAHKALGDLHEQKLKDQTVLALVQKDLTEMPPLPKKDEAKGPAVDPLRTDLLVHDQTLAKLTGELINRDLAQREAPRVSIYQPASAPALKDNKKQVMGTAFAGLLGFGLAGLGAVAVEARAKKVCSLAELTAAGPAPVAGVIPWLPAGPAAADPVRRAAANEAVDKLRAYVAQTWLARGATTVAVTSPIGDEGKAFAAFGLASSLAQAGYKTLLADFDLRNPAVHPFAGVPNGVGVCELLRGEADPRRAVVGLANGLQFLPAGSWSDEARQAAVGGRLEQLLARLREPFDCVVLHSHALLTAAESVEVARRAEVVLLCALYRETRLPLVKRAADRVLAMEVPYSGVVYLGATANEALC